MAPLGYDPGTMVEGGGKAAEGDYTFKVEAPAEVTFKNGSPGLYVELMVGAFRERDIKVFARFSYKPQALWKLNEFLASLGFDFNRPPEVHEIDGKTGRAFFSPNDKGYLEPVEYYAASANNGPDSRSAPRGQSEDGQHNYGPPPLRDDDVPF